MLNPAKLFLINKGEIKTSPNKQKPRDFITTRCDSEEMLKKILQGETKER